VLGNLKSQHDRHLMAKQFLQFTNAFLCKKYVRSLLSSIIVDVHYLYICSLNRLLNRSEEKFLPKIVGVVAFKSVTTNLETSDDDDNNNNNNDNNNNNSANKQQRSQSTIRYLTRLLSKCNDDFRRVIFDVCAKFDNNDVSKMIIDILKKLPKQTTNNTVANALVTTYVRC
jgi:hypothetical protein